MVAEANQIGVISGAKLRRISAVMLAYIRALEKAMTPYNAQGLKITMNDDRLYISY